jgi:hypothetical protein
MLHKPITVNQHFFPNKWASSLYILYLSRKHNIVSVMFYSDEHLKHLAHKIWISDKRFLSFEIFMAVNMKVTLFCNVTPYSLTESYQRFERTCSLYSIELVRSSESWYLWI